MSSFFKNHRRQRKQKTVQAGREVPCGLEAESSAGDSEARSVQPIYSQRARWKHYSRWVSFVLIALLYGALFYLSFEKHFVAKVAFGPRDLIVWVLVLFCTITLVPSLVLEADQVEADDEGLRIKTLFFSAAYGWDKVLSFHNPLILKFAILKLRRIFFLLNRHDLSDFEELVETIRMKVKRPEK